MSAANFSCGPPPIPGALYGYVPASITVAMIISSVVFAVVKTARVAKKGARAPDSGESILLSEKMRWSFPYRLWRFLPAGRDTLTLNPDPSGHKLLFHGKRFYYCPPIPCCGSKDISIPLSNVLQVEATRLPFCQPWKVINSILMAFIYAFLLHLVIASYVGVEVSLGSVEMHTKLGMVWFGQWPFYIVFLLLIRNPCVEVVYGSAGGSGLSRKVYFCVPDTNAAATIAKAIRSLREGEVDREGGGASITLRPSAWFTPVPVISGLVILFTLLLNGIVVGILIMKCQSYGKCRC